MSENIETTETETNVSDGANRHAEYIAKVKKSKLTRRLVFAATVAGAAILAAKYVRTPVPEWADDSEDV